MRLTNALHKYSIGWNTKMQWLRVRDRKIYDGNADAILRRNGIVAIDGVKAYMEPKPKPPMPYEFLPKFTPNNAPLDENHPHFHKRTCRVLGDSQALIFGKKQAQVLTKTLSYTGLPEKYTNAVRHTEISPEIEEQFKNGVIDAHLFNAHQEKLEKKKHPTRLLFNYKRDYGVTDQRKNRGITGKLIEMADKLSDGAVASQRQQLNNVQFVVPFEKDGKLYQFQNTAETIIASKQPVKPIENVRPADLPDIYPLDCDVSIEQENIYQLRNVFPLKKNGIFPHVHTAFLHYSPLDVFNITKEPVKEDQIEARALLKAFTIASAKAQSIYGADVKDLPEPITINIISTHVKRFYFAVYQLNTLNLDGNHAINNFWFSLPPIPLYLQCEYQEARPVLQKYVNDVLRHALVFYQS